MRNVQVCSILRGSPTALESLVITPEHSLVKQSKYAKDCKYPVNADGFGIAWYNLSGQLGCFKSTKPAWNDQNLKYLTRDISSKCFLAHIRAATIGDVSYANAHPFYFQDYAMVHNGTIRSFKDIKRDMVSKLDEDLFLNIRGQTDSEYLFYLILQFHRETKSLEQAVNEAFRWLYLKEQDLPKERFSTLNIVMTDGKSIIATKHSMNKDVNLSLFYAINENSLMIASEKLTDCSNTWKAVPNNSMVVFNQSELSLQIKPLT